MRKFLLALFCILCISSVRAAIKTVVGNSGTGWSNPSNWSPSGVPVSGDEVRIPVGQTISIKGTVYALPYPTLIIKVNGTLDFDPSGKLDVSGTSIVNVYSGGQITSSGTSSELIILGTVTKYNGQNDGNLSGPLYASSATGQSTPGVPGTGFNSGTLPVKLHYFTYTILSNTVLLKWKVTQDSDNDLYTVQRSVNGQWQDLQTIPASGLAGNDISYTFTDHQPASENLYRLKLVGRAGETTYSHIVRVKMDQKQLTISAFPNPASARMTVNWHKPVDGTLSVYNAGGALVYQEQLLQRSETVVNTGSLQNGSYLLVVRTGSAPVAKISFAVSR